MDTSYLEDLHTCLGPGNFRAIAFVSGLARPHVSRFLRGEGGASWAAAVKIADAAGVTLDAMRQHLDTLKRERQCPSR